MVGNIRVCLPTTESQVIRLQYVEVIRDENNGRERWNNFDTQSTGAFQTDIFIGKGYANDQFEASYSYKGFQYV